MIQTIGFNLNKFRTDLSCKVSRNGVYVRAQQLERVDNEECTR